MAAQYIPLAVRSLNNIDQEPTRSSLPTWETVREELEWESKHINSRFASGAVAGAIAMADLLLALTLFLFLLLPDVQPRAQNLDSAVRTCTPWQHCGLRP